jgi:hypothetical protein
MAQVGTAQVGTAHVGMAAAAPRGRVLARGDLRDFVLEACADPSLSAVRIRMTVCLCVCVWCVCACVSG